MPVDLTQRRVRSRMDREDLENSITENMRITYGSDMMQSILRQLGPDQEPHRIGDIDVNVWDGGFTKNGSATQGITQMKADFTTMSDMFNDSKPVHRNELGEPLITGGLAGDDAFRIDIDVDGLSKISESKDGKINIGYQNVLNLNKLGFNPDIFKEAVNRIAVQNYVFDTHKSCPGKGLPSKIMVDDISKFYAVEFVNFLDGVNKGEYASDYMNDKGEAVSGTAIPNDFLMKPIDMHGGVKSYVMADRYGDIHMYHDQPDLKDDVNDWLDKVGRRFRAEMSEKIKERYSNSSVALDIAESIKIEPRGIERRNRDNNGCTWIMVPHMRAEFDPFVSSFMNAYDAKQDPQAVFGEDVLKNAMDLGSNMYYNDDERFDPYKYIMKADVHYGILPNQFLKNCSEGLYPEINHPYRIGPVTVARDENRECSVEFYTIQDENGKTICPKEMAPAELMELSGWFQRLSSEYMSSRYELAVQVSNGDEYLKKSLLMDRSHDDAVSFERSHTAAGLKTGLAEIFKDNRMMECVMEPVDTSVFPPKDKNYGMNYTRMLIQSMDDYKADEPEKGEGEGKDHDPEPGFWY